MKHIRLLYILCLQSFIPVALAWTIAFVTKRADVILKICRSECWDKVIGMTRKGYLEKPMRPFSGYCVGDIHQVFLFFKSMNGSDFKLELGAAIEKFSLVAAHLWSKRVKIIGCLKTRGFNLVVNLIIWRERALAFVPGNASGRNECPNSSKAFERKSLKSNIAGLNRF